MTEHPDQLLIVWWTKNLDQLDREIARLALLSKVKILDPGVIERVLQKDASVCGTDNPVAFRKLHDMVMLHFAIRQKSADSVGQLQTARIEAYVIERLKKVYPGMGELPFGDRDI